MPLQRTKPDGAPTSATTTAAPAAANEESAAFRENAEVNARIDAYIKHNAKEWAYIQSMPRARLERSLILQAVMKQDRREKLRAAVMKKLDENPEMKEAYRTLVKNLPAEKQEAAIINIALRTRRTIAPPEPKQAQSARV